MYREVRKMIETSAVDYNILQVQYIAFCISVGSVNTLLIYIFYL